MKLVKVEKDNCRACGTVSQILNSFGATYESWNIQGLNADEAQKAREVLGQLGFFTVPVTVVLDNEGVIKGHVQGADADALEELVELIK